MLKLILFTTLMCIAHPLMAMQTGVFYSTQPYADRLPEPVQMTLAELVNEIHTINPDIPQTWQKHGFTLCGDYINALQQRCLELLAQPLAVSTQDLDAARFFAKSYIEKEGKKLYADPHFTYEKFKEIKRKLDWRIIPLELIPLLTFDTIIHEIDMHPLLMEYMRQHHMLEEIACK